MDYVFAPPAIVALPIAGSSALFPVRRVYCVGRNYAEHARELGMLERDPPFFFSKPANALMPCADDGSVCVAYPPQTSNLQHEVELVVALGQDLPNAGVDIPVEQALQAVFGYAVGIDLTRRDLQMQAKEKGHPWDMSKGFDQSAPVGAIHPVATTGQLVNRRLWLTVNGEPRQDGNMARMTWSVAEVIAQLSRFVRLVAGDLIFTGTPAGVSPVVPGDVMTCGIEGLGELTCRLDKQA